MGENSESMKTILDKAYDTSPLAHTTNAKKFYDWVKNELPKISRGDVHDYLLSRRIFTQYKKPPPPSKRPTRPIAYKGDFFNMISCDLLTLLSLASKNRGYSYVLCIYEQLSHYAICIPIKSKQQKDMRLS